MTELLSLHFTVIEHRNIRQKNARGKSIPQLSDSNICNVSFDLDCNHNQWRSSLDPLYRREKSKTARGIVTWQDTEPWKGRDGTETQGTWLQSKIHCSGLITATSFPKAPVLSDQWSFPFFTVQTVDSLVSFNFSPNPSNDFSPSRQQCSA